MRRQLNIQTRMLMVAVAPVFMTVLALTLYFLSDRLSRLESDLIDDGRTLARQLSVASEYGLFSGNRSFLEGVAASAMRDSRVAAIVIRDSSRQVLVETGIPVGGGLSSVAYVEVSEEVMRPVTPLNDLFDSDVSTEAGVLGSVQVVLSRHVLAEVRRSVLNSGLIISVVVMIFAIILARYSSRRIAAPIIRVSRAVALMSEGDYKIRVSVRSDTKELQALAIGFNNMAAEIEESHCDLQKKIDAATRELAEKRLDAERSNVAKSRFLAAASHDLRQPLHALGLFVDQLARRSLPPAETVLIDRIVESTEALSSLFDALLDISRLDAGALTPRMTSFALEPLLRRFNQDFGEMAAQKGLLFVVRPTKHWVKSDAAMLERVLINLASNAVRYTEQGVILMAVRRRGKNVRIEVRDSGMGIRREDQALIFSEFVQLGNPERDRRNGLGLGLSVVERMCKLLGHRFGLHSVYGRGSVFWIEVSLATAGDDDVLDLPLSERGLYGRIVALVEDDSSRQAGMGGQLRSWGCSVYSAGDGDELLEVLAAQKVQPDVVICDQQLADGGSGVGLVEKIRERFGQGVLALLITGNSARNDAHDAVIGRYSVLQKPVRPAKLRAILQGMLVTSGDETPLDLGGFSPERGTPQIGNSTES